MAVGSSEAMSIQSASKPKNARAIATGPASTATEISLLDRLSILASVLLTLEQSTTGAAAETPASVAPAGLDAALETSVAADNVANPAAPIEVAHLPETTRADSLFPDGPKGVSHTEQRLAAEASADPLQPMTPSHADAAVAPIVRLGSSTSPTLLNIEVVDDKAGSVPLSMENAGGGHAGERCHHQLGTGDDLCVHGRRRPRQFRRVRRHGRGQYRRFF